MIQKTNFDIIVVGAGHAGCEAALAAARMGMRTAIVTIENQAVSRMSCNPSIGGIAKSHLVCELDALGGEIARNTDYTGIQFRILNTRKGPAVQAYRAQCDKAAFSTRMLSILKNTKNLEVIESIITEILIENGKIKGIKTRDGSVIRGKVVILAPGTFLGGVIHIGNHNFPGGRNGEESASELSLCLKKLGFKIERFKTGTPPRLHKDSIDISKMTIQEGIVPPPFFSQAARKDYQIFGTDKHTCNPSTLLKMFHVEHFEKQMRPWKPGTNQFSCYLTHTTAKTHEIVRENLSLSSLYGGAIKGVGVRYCPSLEDKIVKFPHHESHHVFIEPEGRNVVEVYPNGISNSLPEEVQKKMVHSIPGLEHAVFLKIAYAIEYDFSDPRQLSQTFESQHIENLFFAGQINGTTGYEEAAAQGFLAGVNAVRKIRGQGEFVLSRNDAYMGILADDLVTKGTDEPYRMFTSRAEHRLVLRQDNTLVRLLPFIRELGLVDSNDIKDIEEMEKEIVTEIFRLKNTFSGSSSLAQLLRNPEITYNLLSGVRQDLTNDVITQIEANIKYEGYIKREKEQIARAKLMESHEIPRCLNYDEVPSLRYESREKLKTVVPANLGQASRIPGVNPADIAILSIWIKRIENKTQNSTRNQPKDIRTQRHKE